MNDILTEEEVADILGCEVQTIQEKARTGELPGVKYGRPWRFPRTALLECLHEKAMANKPKGVVTPAAVAVTLATAKPLNQASRRPPALPPH